jgi:hypothetical protein
MSEKLDRVLDNEASYYASVTRPLVPFPLDPVHHLLLPAIGREKLSMMIEVCTSFADRRDRKQPWFSSTGYGLASSKPDLTVSFDPELLRRVTATYPLPLDRQFLNVRSMLLRIIDSGWNASIDVRLPSTFESRLCNVGIYSSNLPPEIAEAAALFVVSRSILRCNIHTAFFLVGMVYAGHKNLRTLANIFPLLRSALSRLAGQDISEAKVNLVRCVKDRRLRNLIPSINATLGLEQLIPKSDTDAADRLAYPETFVPPMPTSRLIYEWLAQQPG